ncbi:unnamed protein product [Adineta ricciae]|uniref:Uncharacterized protein n=1 Tax=Adineta ricciae TaxID=249248 RepID=A0A813YIN5_ADIRI|nr:unnamed protein product [Adineta ricciae]
MENQGKSQISILFNYQFSFLSLSFFLSSTGENSINIPTNDHHEISSNDCVEGLALSMTRIIEGDTYPISDNDSATDSMYIIDTNIGKLPQTNDEQDELNRK